MIGVHYIKYVNDIGYVVKNEISKHMFTHNNQIRYDWVQAYRDEMGYDHVLQNDNTFFFCETILEAESSRIFIIKMDNFQNQIEMELIQQQANDNTFDILTGKITINELLESNNDNIPLLVQTKEVNDLEDRLDVLEGMIEYYTEREEYEKCAELVKLKNKLWS